MRFKKRIISFLLTFVMVLTLLPISVFADGVKNFTIVSVTYTEEALTSSEEFSTITEIVYDDEGEENTLTVDSDKLATLTVDGVQYDIVEGETFEFTEDAVITLTAKDATNLKTVGGPGLFLVGGLTPADSIDYYIRAAAYINEGSLNEEYSVLSAIISGEVNSTKATDTLINSQGSFFNGFYINNSQYTIDGLDMTLSGNGADDFNGFGAGIMTTGSSVVDITDTKINSTGAIRTAIWAGGASTIDVEDSVITAYGADTESDSYASLIVPMLKRVPWALGLEGTTRATNVLGGATANYSNSIIVSENWGALSTDSGVSGTTALNVENVLAGIGYLEVAIVGKEYDAVKTVKGVDYGLTIANSGYVTYADAGVINYYNDVEFYSPDYIIILASRTSSGYFTGDDTVAVSKRVGAMWHQNQGGILSLDDGSWSASDIMFLAKSTSGNTACPKLTVDGTELNITGTDSYSGVLFQLMESDDAGGPFASGYTIPETENDWSTVNVVDAASTAAEATFVNVDTVGDIYNSVYTVNQDLNVAFKTSTITGTISSSNANHVEEDGDIILGGTRMTPEDKEAYLFAGRIVNTASEAVNNDINLTLEDSTWVATGTSYLSYLNIDENSAITAQDGYLVTLTVNGTETPITAGEYTGDIVLTTTPYLGLIGSYNRGTENLYNYRTALFVDASGINENNSVLSAIVGGTYNDDEVDGITVDSTTSGFSSIMVVNNEEESDTKYFNIKNSIFNALSDSDGSDVNDFTGYGATIAAYGDVNLTIDNVDVTTTGVAKVAFLSDGGADLFVKNSTFSVLGGTLYEGYLNSADQNKMVAPPWVLGISGNARGTNLLGENSTSTFVDSDFETTAWGILSVDAGRNGVINVINSTLTTLSNTGYGIYAIGGAKECFYGTTFNVGTYPAILTGGSLKFTSSEGIETYNTVNGVEETVLENIVSNRVDGVTTVNSQFGVMAHNSGSIELEKGTIFNTKNAAFLIKSGTVDIKVDDSELNVEDGIILQMIDNDDTIVGVTMGVEGFNGPVFNTVFNEAQGYPSEAYIGTGEVSGPFGTTPAPEGYVYDTEDAVSATFTNVDLEGDMYNATGYLAQAKGLDVILGVDATLKGAISASSAMHVQMEVGEDGYYYDYVTDENGEYDQATSFTIDEYYLLGHVANKAYFNGYNTVSVTLTDNAVWTVTDTSNLKELTIAEGASVVGTMTVDGIETTIIPGNIYTGEITLSAIVDKGIIDDGTTSNGTSNNVTTDNGTSVTINKNVTTGDDANTILWISLSTLALLGCTFAGYYCYFSRKKEQNK